MYTILNNLEKSFEIKKSKFICLIYKIETLEEINKILSLVKNSYKGADHYCYAYILDNYIRYNDDSEPSGTAGIPMLNILQKNNLNHVLCIIVRYFGGVKLGSSNLLRTYSNCVKDTLKNIIPLEKYINIKIKFKYEYENEINKLNFKLNDKNYNDYVTYYITINEKELNIYENNKYILETKKD